MVFILGINYPERMLVRDMLKGLYGISSKSKSWFYTAPSTYAQEKLPETLPANTQPMGTFTSSRTTADDDKSSSTFSHQTSSQQEQQDKLPPPSPRRHNILSRILAKHHIHVQQQLGSLTQPQVQSLSQTLADLTIENDLRRKVQDDIKKLAEINSYRGKRHAMNLPVRGQRTRSQVANAFKLNKIERKG